MSETLYTVQALPDSSVLHSNPGQVEDEEDKIEYKPSAFELLEHLNQSAAAQALANSLTVSVPATAVLSPTPTIQQPLPSAETLVTPQPQISLSQTVPNANLLPQPLSSASTFMNIRKDKPYKCEVCRKGFSVRAYLKRHQQIPDQEKHFSCSYCQKVFPQRDRLKNHERTHLGVRPFTCEYCKKNFSRKDHLKNHQRCHTGEKPFRCTVCNRAFSQRDRLRNHGRTHTGERPFQCQVCKKAFSRKDHLNKHERTHMGEKQYSCSVCGKQFSQRTHLEKHRNSHCNDTTQQAHNAATVAAAATLLPTGSLPIQLASPLPSLTPTQHQVPLGTTGAVTTTANASCLQYQMGTGVVSNTQQPAQQQASTMITASPLGTVVAASTACSYRLENSYVWTGNLPVAAAAAAWNTGGCTVNTTNNNTTLPYPIGQIKCEYPDSAEDFQTALQYNPNMDYISL